MPNIRSQQIDSQGITIVASDGRTFSVTKEEISANYNLQGGSASTRKSKTIAWLKSRIGSALGIEQIDSTKIIADFRTSDGVPTNLEVSD